MTYQTLEEACQDMIKLTKEWAAHPAISCDPKLVVVKFKTTLRRSHGHCGRRWGEWHIAYNLYTVKANLHLPEELLLLVKHEVAHIKEQNHSLRFKAVLRQLGYPEDHLTRARSTTRLANYTPENKFICLRCGMTKTTQRAMSEKMKVCEWCGHTWDTEANKMDRSHTMALFPLTQVKSVQVVRYAHQVDRIIKQTRGMPWQQYAEYRRDGGEFDPVSWWDAIREIDAEAALDLRIEKETPA